LGVAAEHVVAVAVDQDRPFRTTSSLWRGTPSFLSVRALMTAIADGLGRAQRMRTQVTFDTTDPHAQAKFWAAVLGLEIEDHADLVDRLVAENKMTAEDRVRVDGRSAFRTVAACRDPRGIEPRFFFQAVPEQKTAKNRVHLDIHVEPEEKRAEVDRLTTLGARLISTHDDQGPVTYVMRDPEGNEFCIH
jgi:catechol 2,3-dioxygenase-like lactoylglutathione lyase family enzyme